MQTSREDPLHYQPPAGQQVFPILISKPEESLGYNGTLACLKYGRIALDVVPKSRGCRRIESESKERGLVLSVQSSSTLRDAASGGLFCFQSLKDS